MFTIVSVGFGEFTAAALRAVAMIFGGDGLMGVVVTLAISLAILFAVGRMLVQAKLEIGPLIIAVVAFYIMFIPKVDVRVEDRITGRIDVVQSVPLGVAAAGGITSQLGVGFSGMMQTVFYTGQEEPQLTANYFSYPLRLMMTIRRMGACDLGPAMCHNTIAYHRECVEPLVIADRFDMRRVVDPSVERPFDYYFGRDGAVPELSQMLVGFRNPPNLDQSSLGTCQELADTIYDNLEFCSINPGAASSEICAQVTRGFTTFIAQRMNTPGANMTGATSETPGTLSPELQMDPDRLREQLQSLMGAFQEERFLLANQIMSNIQDAGGTRFTAEAAWMTQVMERQRVAAATEASGFLRMTFFIMGLMQFIFIAITPVIALVGLAKLNAGFKVYGGWFLLGLWSSSFLVMITIIDYWAVTSVRSRLSNPDFISNELAAAATSLPGMQGIYNHIADILTTANTFMTAAPLVLLALLTGSIYPLAGMAQRLAGGPEVGMQPGMTAVSDKGAGVMMANQTSIQDSGSGRAQADNLTQSLKINVGQEYQARLANARQNAEQLNEQFAASRDQMWATVDAYARTFSFDQSEQRTDSKELAVLAAVGRAAIEDESIRNTITDEQAAQLVRKAALGGRVSAGAELFGSGASVSASGSTESGITDSESVRQELNQAISNIREGRSSESFTGKVANTLSDTYGNQVTDEARNSASDAVALKQQLTAARSEVNSITAEGSQATRLGLAQSLGTEQTARAMDVASMATNGGNARDRLNALATSAGADAQLRFQLLNFIPAGKENDVAAVHQGMAKMANFMMDNDIPLEQREIVKQVFAGFYGTKSTVPVGELNQDPESLELRRSDVEAAREVHLENSAATDGDGVRSLQGGVPRAGGRTVLPSLNETQQAGDFAETNFWQETRGAYGRFAAARGEDNGLAYRVATDNDTIEKKGSLLRSLTGMDINTAVNDAHGQNRWTNRPDFFSGGSYNETIERLRKYSGNEAADRLIQEQKQAHSLTFNESTGKWESPHDPRGGFFRRNQHNPQYRAFNGAATNIAESAGREQNAFAELHALMLPNQHGHLDEYKAATALGSGGLSPEEVFPESMRGAVDGGALQGTAANLYAAASSDGGRHWRTIASNTEGRLMLSASQGGDWLAPPTVSGQAWVPQDRKEMLSYIHDTRFDPMVYSQHESLVHSEEVNGAAMRTAAMSDEQFAQAQDLFRQGRHNEALEIVGLENPETNPLGALNQRSAGYARGPNAPDIERESLLDRLPQDAITALGGDGTKIDPNSNFGRRSWRR